MRGGRYSRLRTVGDIKITTTRVFRNHHRLSRLAFRFGVRVKAGALLGCESCSDGGLHDINSRLGLIHRDRRYCRASLSLHAGLRELGNVLERTDTARGWLLNALVVVI